MDLIADPQHLQRTAQDLRRAGRRIALVPTMGCLHAGHLSLAALARAEAEVVILSLFVNPAQFGPQEDFARYPRPFARDRALCQDAGVQILFHPAPEAMYRPGASVVVDETALARGLCGASRPGHFRGVLTVVAKLLHLALPDVAVFGQKDAQQLRIIRQMVRDLDVPVRLIAAPIVREPDGLAMSSRNRYLSPAERQAAVCLSRALRTARRQYRGGERRTARLVAAMQQDLAATPEARPDYVAVVDQETLQPVDTLTAPALAALAVRIGATRLIDNSPLPDDDRLANLPE